MTSLPEAYRDYLQRSVRKMSLWGFRQALSRRGVLHTLPDGVHWQVEDGIVEDLLKWENDFISLSQLSSFVGVTYPSIIWNIRKHGIAINLDWGIKSISKEVAIELYPNIAGDLNEKG